MGGPDSKSNVSILNHGRDRLGLFAVHVSIQNRNSGTHGVDMADNIGRKL